MCNCEQVEIFGHATSCMDGYCMTDADYVEFIRLAFEGSDGCVIDNATEDSIQFFLDISKTEFNDPELVFLRAYQSTIFSVMSCYSRSYDITERYGESQMKVEGKSKALTDRQGNKVSASSSHGTNAMTARYNDYSRAMMDADAARNGCSRNDTYNSINMDDSSAGSKVNRARKRAISKASQDVQAHSFFDNNRTDKGKSDGFDFAKTYSGKAEDHVYAFILSATEIGEQSNSTKQSKHTSSSEGVTTNDNQDWSIINKDKISLEGVRKDSVGNYSANVVSSSNSTSSATGENIYTANRTQRQRAEGQGFQRQAADASSQVSMTGNDTYSKEAESRKQTTGWKFSTISSYKHSQKYASLKMLYDILERQIQEAMIHNGVLGNALADYDLKQPFTQRIAYPYQEIKMARLLRRFPFLSIWGDAIIRNYSESENLL